MHAFFLKPNEGHLIIKSSFQKNTWRNNNDDLTFEITLICVFPDRSRCINMGRYEALAFCSKSYECIDADFLDQGHPQTYLSNLPYIIPHSVSPGCVRSQLAMEIIVCICFRNVWLFVNWTLYNMVTVRVMIAVSFIVTVSIKFEVSDAMVFTQPHVFENAVRVLSSGRFVNSSICKLIEA